MKRPAMLLAATVIAVVSGGPADAALSKTGNASVAFNAAGPAGMKITGTTSDFQVSENGGQISLKVPLGNLTTGIALRDRHMREKYLEVQTYPNAELSVARSSLKLPAAGASSSGDAQGKMKIHGKEKDVTFHYTVQKQGSAYAVTGSVHLLLGDYGITVPSYLGVTVKPDIDVNVQFAATE